MDPNDDSKVSFVGYWLIYSDLMNLSDVSVYYSLPQLAEMLVNATPEVLDQKRVKMRRENDRIRKQNHNVWKKVLAKIDKS